LSFALQKLPIPVIVVGSQRSADRPSSDAATNLIGAVRAAAYAPFAEVAVAMHETPSDETIIFHRGTKTRKCHTSRRDAFKSINTSPLGRMRNGQIEMLLENYCRRGSSSKLILKPNFNEKVALIKFYPNLDPDIIEWYISENYKGIILEGTGLGHVGRYCFSKIRDAIRNDIVVGMTSQCLWGRIGMNVYNQGRDLLALGVIPLDDMLPETALVKLMWILGQTDDAEEAKNLLSMNIADEISPRTRIGDTA
jgi:glutamyl-tRNA(Gln) amidotransferase subunit D